jgi:hypothetical protein
MVRDHLARELLKKAVLRFGSQYHLARALGTTREHLLAWMEAREEYRRRCTKRSSIWWTTMTGRASSAALPRPDTLSVLL